jgi:hypothetical protein
MFRPEFPAFFRYVNQERRLENQSTIDTRCEPGNAPSYSKEAHEREHSLSAIKVHGLLYVFCHRPPCRAYGFRFDTVYLSGMINEVLSNVRLLVVGRQSHEGRRTRRYWHGVRS